MVAAALALLAAALIGEPLGLAAGLLAALLLGLGSVAPAVSWLNVGAIDLGSYKLNYLAVAGNIDRFSWESWGRWGFSCARSDDQGLTAAVAAKSPGGDLEVDGPAPNSPISRSWPSRRVWPSWPSDGCRPPGPAPPGLEDLTAGPASSAFCWPASRWATSWGKIADFFQNEKQASWLFLAASILSLAVLLTEKQPEWLAQNLLGGEGKAVLSQAITLSELKLGNYSIAMTWPYRILFVVTLVFFLPALSLGTVSPVVAKLAVDRLKRYKRTGTAIGQVYAWGMVGSILGTFLTGFFLIDILGTKGVILLLGTTMAFGATLLGTVWHAVWAGIPLGLCVLAFTPPAFVDAIGKVFPYVKGAAFEDIGKRWGIREQLGNPDDPKSEFVWIDESKYYYIKVENEVEDDGAIEKRTLVLDNLIHGYFILGHPERLDYDYEHIYALVAYRAALANGKVKFKPAWQTRYLQHF